MWALVLVLPVQWQGATGSPPCPRAVSFLRQLPRLLANPRDDALPAVDRLSRYADEFGVDRGGRAEPLPKTQERSGSELSLHHRCTWQRTELATERTRPQLSGCSVRLNRNSNLVGEPCAANNVRFTTCAGTSGSHPERASCRLCSPIGSPRAGGIETPSTSLHASSWRHCH